MKWLKKVMRQVLMNFRFYQRRMNEKSQEPTYDYVRAMELYLPAAQRGDTEAMMNLTILYGSKNSGFTDYEECLRLLNICADREVSEAQYRLCCIYGDGEIVERDYETAVQWGERAAEQNHPRAMRWLGWAYFYGLGVEQSYEKSAAQLRAAAELGERSAMSALGWMYLSAQGVDKDDDEALKLFDAAARLGYNDGYLGIGVTYLFRGHDDAKFYGQAVDMLHLAAEKDVVEAQLLLAAMYASGKIVQRNYELAARLRARADELNDAQAVRWYEAMRQGGLVDRI
ncbi:hypothetical protein C4J81_18390 [Deltaproteobacteria bacterium Smac51]|nr:hypothetical protein C4J81_18390 [Deltaproteobacteria bacterium Smac51]